jgi:immunoglobulin-binding protein 1
MDTQPRSLRELFADAEHDRKGLERPGESTTSASFQENLANAIATYEECLKVASRVSLFSPNETLEDINSKDLQYLLLNFHLAELTLKITGGDRKGYLETARTYYERFLKLLDMYDMLSKADSKLYEQYLDSPNSFSTASTSDAVARRDTKIARFKEEKELKRKLDVCLLYARDGPIDSRLV